ncbi:MAG: SgcJ/EcaC family oxidoreductase [Acidobacteria bacterium]|nr:SgcJ/EcaC family oxidoreductase [Acidobacteriota bacterium]
MRPAVWRWEDFRVAAVALAVLASVAATVPQTPDRDVEAVINQWVAAFASLDGATSAAVYADDARLWGTIAQEPNVGHDAIRAYFDSGRQRAKARHVVIGDHATRVYGTTAVSSGRYDFHSVLHDGTSTVRRARFSMTFVLRDGRWRIVDHHSSEVPAAP